MSARLAKMAFSSRLSRKETELSGDLSGDEWWSNACFEFAIFFALDGRSNSPLKA